MVGYIVDSDIIINFLKGKGDADQILRNVKKSQIYVSVISVGEVLEGVVGQEERGEEARKLFGSWKVLAINMQTVEIFAQMRSIMRKQGILIDNMDLLIAATAIEHDLILITNNKKDFQRIRGLKMF